MGEGGREHILHVSPLPSLQLPFRTTLEKPVYLCMSSPGPEVHIVLISTSPAPNSNPHPADSPPALKQMGEYTDSFQQPLHPPSLVLLGFVFPVTRIKRTDNFHADESNDTTGFSRTSQL
ncbi:unnamed protein product [Gulo gulo]|uniref:Uncharacterized protein n=1 Tax=Gulo gulo TaxID=48420 RepID=A0A9X9LU70_GULGU|nr:unnamed protein product [Gulo gulo]